MRDTSTLFGPAASAGAAPASAASPPAAPAASTPSRAQLFDPGNLMAQPAPVSAFGLTPNVGDAAMLGAGAGSVLSAFRRGPQSPMGKATRMFQAERTGVARAGQEATQAAAQHAQVAQDLARQLAAEKDYYSAASANLARAEARNQMLNGPGSFSPPTALTPTPAGGSGTANYAMKFGATPPEAAQVPSMSVMQQSNIPQQAQAWQKIQALEPGTQQFAESPLLLPPGGAQSAALDRARQTAISDNTLATAKAAAKADYETASKAYVGSNARMQKLTDALAQHLATPATESPAAAALRGAAGAIEDAYPGAVRETLARLGTRWLPRLAPVAGLAMAPIQGEQAAQEWKQGDPFQAAAHAGGALGNVLMAAPNPVAVGAGEMLQVPAMAADAYGALSDPAVQAALERLGARTGQNYLDAVSAAPMP